MENGNESFTYFNDEWNIEPTDANNEPTTNHDYGDEDFIDNVDIDDITYIVYGGGRVVKDFFIDSFKILYLYLIINLIDIVL